MAILSVNVGSSTLKFSIYPIVNGDIVSSILTGEFQGLEPGGVAELHYRYGGNTRSSFIETKGGDSFSQALTCLENLMDALPGIPNIELIAHRVVHGGAIFSDSVIATDDILAALAELNSLAPLHQPHNLAGVRTFAKAYPKIPQVLCFDTAFHRNIPLVETAFAIPQEITARGVRRYGFHGLSYQYISQSLLSYTSRAKGRMLMAHLGNGASLCAAIGGKSIATTMGFSALDGLMMGTRAGSLDAGVLLYLLENGYSQQQIANLLYKNSGLLGVSGVSADMRTLRASSDRLASEAIDLFGYRVVRDSGAMIACMGGLDLIGFSGGIGEHDVLLRKDLCNKLSWLGIQLDDGLNQSATQNQITKISSSDSEIEVWVVPTDEGIVAAKDALKLVQAQQ